jgi:hypothetical protein
MRNRFHALCAAAVVAAGMMLPAAAAAQSASMTATITADQIRETHETSLADAIRRLQPTWLDPVNTEAVYLDNNYLGDLTSLGQVLPASVSAVRHLNIAQARQAFGAQLNSGVIQILSNAPAETAMKPGAKTVDAWFRGPRISAMGGVAHMSSAGARYQGRAVFGGAITQPLSAEFAARLLVEHQSLRTSFAGTVNDFTMTDAELGIIGSFGTSRWVRPYVTAGAGSYWISNGYIDGKRRLNGVFAGAGAEARMRGPVSFSVETTYSLSSADARGVLIHPMRLYASYELGGHGSR